MVQITIYLLLHFLFFLSSHGINNEDLTLPCSHDFVLFYQISRNYRQKEKHIFSSLFLRKISQNVFIRRSQDLHSQQKFNHITSSLYCSDTEEVSRGSLPSKNAKELYSSLIYQRSLQTRGLGTIRCFLFLSCPKHSLDLK